MKLNKRPKSAINTEERNGRLGTMFLLCAAFFIVFASIAVAVFIPYLSSLPLYNFERQNFNLSYITSTTELDDSKQLTLTSKRNEVITFYSDNSEVVFENEDPVFLYGDKNGVNSVVSFKFFVEGEYIGTSFDIYVCSETGESITKLERNDYGMITNEDNETIVTYGDEKNIFIYSVSVSYQLRYR